MANNSISEKLCWCFIRWCENHRLLNAECGLSTIEYIRQSDPVEALAYINQVMARANHKMWKMPLLGEKRLKFESTS